MPEKPRLNLLLAKRLAKQGVVHEVNLAYRKVVGCVPIRIDLAELFGV
jgi:hypothetical protein